jgi:hypothetical protein
MDTNVISDNCMTLDLGHTDFGSKGFSGGAVQSTIPEPGTASLVGMGFLGLIVYVRQARKRAA